MKLRHLLLERKVKTNLDSILKSRDITLPTKVHLVKAMVFPVVMYGCERILQSYFDLHFLMTGFPGGASGKEPTCQCRRCKRCRLNPWARKFPWRRAWHPTPVFLPGKSHGQRNLAGYSLQLDTTEATKHACMNDDYFFLCYWNVWVFYIFCISTPYQIYDLLCFFS